MDRLAVECSPLLGPYSLFLSRKKFKADMTEEFRRVLVSLGCNVPSQSEGLVTLLSPLSY